MKKVVSTILIVTVILFLSSCSANTPENGDVSDPLIDINDPLIEDEDKGMLSDLKLTPEDAYDIFKAKYPDARVKEIELERENQSYVYEVEGYEGNMEYKIEIDPYDAKIIKTEEDNDNTTKGEIKREDLSRIPVILKKAVEVATKEGFKLKDWTIEVEGKIIEFEIKFISNGEKIEHKYNLETGELINIKQK